MSPKPSSRVLSQTWSSHQFAQVHFFETSCAKKEGVDAALQKAKTEKKKKTVGTSGLMIQILTTRQQTVQGN